LVCTIRVSYPVLLDYTFDAILVDHCPAATGEPAGKSILVSRYNLPVRHLRPSGAVSRLLPRKMSGFAVELR
jgi:hypothetical protein